MIIPDNDVRYREDGVEFSVEMIDYIRTHFGDVLGEDAKLSNEPGGLEKLAPVTRKRLANLPKAA